MEPSFPRVPTGHAPRHVLPRIPAPHTDANANADAVAANADVVDIDDDAKFQQSPRKQHRVEVAPWSFRPPPKSMPRSTPIDASAHANANTPVCASVHDNANAHADDEFRYAGTSFTNIERKAGAIGYAGDAWDADPAFAGDVSDETSKEMQLYCVRCCNDDFKVVWFKGEIKPRFVCKCGCIWPIFG